MAPILNRSPLSAITFVKNNVTHIRVFYQATNGDIKVTHLDGSAGWSTGAPKDVVGFGLANTGIASCQWDNGSAIRVYFIGPNSTIVERLPKDGEPGDWKDGALTDMKIKAAAYSKLACVKCPDSLHVVYQDTANKIREVVYSSGGWTEGTSGLPTALGGTSITAACKPSGNIWVYTQEQDNRISEWLYSNGVTPQRGYQSGPQNPGCGVSVALWGDTQIRLLTVNLNNKFRVTVYNGSWQQPEILADAIPGSDVAIVDIGDKGNLRGFYQPQGGIIAGYTAPNSDNWTAMVQNAPTSP